MVNRIVPGKSYMINGHKVEVESVLAARPSDDVPAMVQAYRGDELVSFVRRQFSSDASEI